VTESRLEVLREEQRKETENALNCKTLDSSYEKKIQREKMEMTGSTRSLTARNLWQLGVKY